MVKKVFTTVIIKRHLSFFLTCCTLAYPTRITAQSGNINGLIYDLLNIQDRHYINDQHSMDLHPALFRQLNGRQIIFKTTYEDIYRERIAGVNTFTYNQLHNTAKVVYPFQWQDRAAIFSFKGSHHSFSLADRDNHTFLDFDINDGNWSYSAVFGLETRPHRFGIFYRLSHTSYRDKYNITSYPDRSNNLALNHFFYDLLQPTFGSEFDLASNTVTQRFNIQYFIDLTERISTGVLVKRTSSNRNFSVSYLNSGSEKLQGLKHNELPFNSNHTGLSILSHADLNAKLQLRSNFEIFRTNYSISFIPVNPSQNSSIFLDLTDLGGGSVERKGINVGTGIIWSNGKGESTGFSVLLSRSRWNGSADVSTPVLGYTIGNFLPIAHQFYSDISGRIDSRMYQIHHSHHTGSRFYYTLAGGLVDSRIDFDVNGFADMEFGIKTTPLDERYSYTGQLYHISFSPAIRFGNSFTVNYGLSQLIPVFKQKHKKPSGEYTPGVKVKKTIRGGTIHELKLMMSF